MYWLRWHYYAKDTAGAQYKIKQNEKKDTSTESKQSYGQTTVILHSTITIA